MDLVSRQRQQLHCVFHMTPQSVVSDPRYLQWMSMLGDNVHVITLILFGFHFSFLISILFQTAQYVTTK